MRLSCPTMQCKRIILFEPRATKFTPTSNSEICWKLMRLMDSFCHKTWSRKDIWIIFEYWNSYCMSNTSPHSFTLGQAFHCPPNPPLSWFAHLIVWVRAITHVLCQGLKWMWMNVNSCQYCTVKHVNKIKNQ